MQIKMLAERDSFVLARGDDGIRVLGEMLTLANYTENYAREPLFFMLEQCRNAIEAQTYVVMYRRSSKDNENFVVPLGFFLLGHLSEPMDALFMNGLRAHTPAELRSGDRFRCGLAVFPYAGYFDTALSMLWEAYPNEPEIGYKKLSDINAGKPVLRFMRRNK